MCCCWYQKLAYLFHIDKNMLRCPVRWLVIGRHRNWLKISSLFKGNGGKGSAGGHQSSIKSKFTNLFQRTHAHTYIHNIMLGLPTVCGRSKSDHLLHPMLSSFYYSHSNVSIFKTRMIWFTIDIVHRKRGVEWKTQNS